MFRDAWSICIPFQFFSLVFYSVHTQVPSTDACFPCSDDDAESEKGSFALLVLLGFLRVGVQQETDGITMAT
jgi:hypothetical protein